MAMIRERLHSYMKAIGEKRRLQSEQARRLMELEDSIRSGTHPDVPTYGKPPSAITFYEYLPDPATGRQEILMSVDWSDSLVRESTLVVDPNGKIQISNTRFVAPVIPSPSFY